MSYGRDPYYIYESSEGFHFCDVGLKGPTVPYDAIAQFVASLAWRGDEQINKLIARGCELRPTLGKVSVEVKKE